MSKKRRSPLDGINMMYPQPDTYMDDEGDDGEPDDVIILHMDIRQPLRSLMKLVETKLGMDLTGYKFWLQEAQELEPHKNLVDQCVKGEGLVQINVQVQTTNQRINILDVLKPTEAALAALSLEEANKALNTIANDEDQEMREGSSSSPSAAETDQKPFEGAGSPNKRDKPCLNWVLDSKFKKEQTRLKIPDDPCEWTVPHVNYWFHWAMRQFNLTNVNTGDWTINGKELCSLTHEDFTRKVPTDPGSVFWTHLQLLKECKFVSVVHKVVEGGPSDEMGKGATSKLTLSTLSALQKEHRIMRKGSTLQQMKDSPSVHGSPTSVSSGGNNCVGSGNNGQVQLWQFLLDILTDREHVDIIQWVGTEGEFKLTDPERVARLWGERKNKPAMNYEKLSRALRYYYDGDMISKVSGKRFAYKFDCDLKLLLGYTAAELSTLVSEKAGTSTYLNVDSNSDDE